MDVTKLKSLKKEVQQELADALSDEGVDGKVVRDLRKQIAALEGQLAEAKKQNKGTAKGSGDTGGDEKDEVDSFLETL